MIRLIPMLIILVLIIGLFLGVIFLGLKEDTSGTKVMLLGISIILLGGIIAIDPNSNLGGIEYLIILSGMVASVLGLRKKD